jgi:hypothetical protein
LDHDVHGLLPARLTAPSVHPKSVAAPATLKDMTMTPHPGPDAIARFVTEGFLRLDNAFSPALAASCRALLWQAAGLSPDRPAEWTRPVIRIPFRSDAPFRAAANTPKLHSAYDALTGPGRWLVPQSLGSFPLRFPAPEDPDDAGWHVDASFGTEATDFMDWRVNVLSRGRALLMLFLFTDVGEEDAPTRLRAGSHAHMARALLPHGEKGMTLREMVEGDFGGSSGCETALATGPAGTVYLCHPFLVHAAQPHRGLTPRFMAQPALLPAQAFDPALPPSPVQIAIRRACGLPEA